MNTTDRNILERFSKLPTFMQHQIESALFGPGDAPAGSTLDRVREARLASMVTDAEKALAASKQGTTPEIRADRPSTLPRDRRGAGGALPGHPHVSSVATASAAATRAVAEAVRVERARLLAAHRIAPGPLPANLDQALAEVDRRIVAAANAGNAEMASSIFRSCLADLWSRPDVLSTFATRDELLAYFDLQHVSKGTHRPRR